MEFDHFWLLTIEESRLSVSLVNIDSQSAKVLSSGPVLDWDPNLPDSFLNAFDQSLSQSAQEANLPENSEPDKVSLILPPFWLTHDGKIIKDKLDLITSACKKMKLKALGYIASDDAIVEYYNKQEEYPSSYILLGLSHSQFALSLVYFGKIKSKILKKFDSIFIPEYLESALLELNSTSTLPPQITVYGDQTASLISDLNNYPWVSKKDVETFLHLPNIESIDSSEIIRIYSKVIYNQIKSNLLLDPKSSSPVDEAEIVAEVTPVLEVETTSVDDESSDIQTDMPQVADDVEEVPLINFGFTAASLDPVSPPELIPTPEPTSELIPNIVPPPELNLTPPKPSLPKFDFNNFLSKLKSIPFPKISLRAKNKKIPLIIISILPLFLLIPFLFSTAKITIFINPYQFELDTRVNLDSTTTQIDALSKSIPVTKQSFTVSSSIVVPTTGTLTKGEKAKGEVTIFNKTDQPVDLAQSTLLQDSTGRSFELLSPVSVPASSSDLEEGVINLGKIQATVIAGEIGPESNLSKDTELIFKNYSKNQLIAKVSESLTGGTKEDIPAVAKADKDQIESQLSQSIQQAIDDKVDQDVERLEGLIMDTVKKSPNRIVYSREIGEEADELSASVEAEISAFVINPQIKGEIISAFLSSNPDFDKAEINPESFDITFKVIELENSLASTQLTLNGFAKPKLNESEIKQNISGKSSKKAKEYLTNNIPRAINFNIKTNFSYLEFINPLPFRQENITIETKTESL